MNNILIILTVIFLSSVNNALSDSIPVTKIDTLPNLSWERVYNDKYYKISIATINPKSKELVLAGNVNNFRTDIQKIKGIWIWKINNDGNKIADVTLKEITVDKTISKPFRLISMLVNEDESIWLIVESDFPRVQLIKTNFNGDILMATKMTGGITISKVLPLSNKGFLVIGDIAGKASFMKIDATGKEVWKKTSIRNAYGKFYDGIPAIDGGFILVENSGATNSYALDGNAVFLTKYSADGVKQDEKSFPGRLGSLVTGPNDTFAVLYDKNAFEGLGYLVQSYDMGLNLKWSLNVATHKYAINNFKIRSLNNGNYIVTGDTFGDFKTFVAYIDASGVQKWDYNGNTFVYGTDITCTGATCYLVEVVSNDVDTNNEDIKQVKAIKFQPN